jgi:hypothetical protein
MADKDAIQPKLVEKTTRPDGDEERGSATERQSMRKSLRASMRKSLRASMRKSLRASH